MDLRTARSIRRLGQTVFGKQCANSLIVAMFGAQLGAELGEEFIQLAW